MPGEISGGRYALLDLLGAGGMAEVFLARDRILGRDLALKVLREDYAEDADFVSRFQREAISAAALNHRHVVQVYDQGRAEVRPEKAFSRKSPKDSSPIHRRFIAGC